MTQTKTELLAELRSELSKYMRLTAVHSSALENPYADDVYRIRGAIAELEGNPEHYPVCRSADCQMCGGTQPHDGHGYCTYDSRYQSGDDPNDQTTGDKR